MSTAATGPPDPRPPPEDGRPVVDPSNPQPALTTRQRRADQKAQRRQELIDAAINLWPVSGSRGTGLTAVANAAGMTHAGLLHHFGTKANLLVAVIEELDRHDRTILQRYYDTGDIDQLWSHYPDIARANESAEGLKRLFIVLIGESIDPGADEHLYFTERYERVVKRTETLLRSAQQQNRIYSWVDCRQAAQGIIAFMDGALIQWLLDPQPGGLVIMYEQHFKLLGYAIGLRPAPPPS